MLFYGYIKNNGVAEPTELPASILKRDTGPVQLRR